MYRADRPESVEQLFLQQLTLIERVTASICARNRVAAAEAEDFCSLVKVKVIEDSYAVLRRFEHRSTLKTYLTIVIQRLFLDYRNSMWGKWRPSAEAKRGGAVAVLLERLITRDGHTFDEACELLKTKHQIRAGRAELERIVGALPDRVRRRFAPDDDLRDVPAKTLSPDEAVAEGARQATADRVSAALKALLARLDTQDRLLLTLRFPAPDVTRGARAGSPRFSGR